MNGETTANQNSEKVTVDIPANLIAQMDAQIGSVFVDRAEFMRAAVRYYLDYIRESQGIAPSDIG